MTAVRKLSVHQLPKSKPYLSTWVARPDHLWVDFDFAAQEQFVLAELSEDPALMQLYGPGASKNQCIYLHAGANYPLVGPQIRKLYDPANPPCSKERLEEAKHLLKAPRSIAKRWKLGMSYGMGWSKLQRESRLVGVELTDEEAKAVIESDHRTFAGVLSWQRRLEAEWEDRGGWVYNGLARPLAVCYDAKKDLVNRVVQSTSHDITMRLIYIISKKVDADRVPMWPVIVDFHDQTTWECPLTEGTRCAKLIEDSLAQLNRELAGIIPLRGEVKLIKNLAESKCED